jgi:hypothetical protein
MNYYEIAASKSPDDIGARGYDQIKSADRNVELMNNLFGLRSIDGIEEASKSVIDLRYNAKVTDVIWSGLFSQV